MEDKKKEIRRITGEIRAVEPTGDNGSRRVEGYAALFGTDSKLISGFFVERIAHNAFDGVIERSDVLCLLDHDASRGVLARSRQGEGSLELRVDLRGLHYAFDAPRTALGDELLEGLRRGDISESSFAFVVEDDVWEDGVDGNYRRTILKIHQLYDVSPVYHPAYTGTEVSARSLDEVRQMLNPIPAGYTQEEIKALRAEYLGD